MRLLLFFCIYCSGHIWAQHKGQITGVISDSIHPLKAVKITLEPIGLTTFSNEKGMFSLPNLTKGNYILYFSSKEYLPFSRKVFVDDSTVNLDIQLIKNHTLQAIEIKKKIAGELSEVLQTRQSISILTIRTKKTLDKLFNKNAADLAAKMPSVMLFRSKGESNMVSLRGTPSDWTAVLVDGDRLPVACEDNTTRTFEFEAFPSIFVDELIEARSITPDLEADNIGGSLNFLSVSPMDSTQLILELAPGINTKGTKPTGSLHVQFNNVSTNKKWAYLINGMYYGRAYASDAQKTIFGSNLNHGINRLELRKYDGLRSSVGGQFAVVFQPNSKFQLKINSFLGRMTDDKNMRKISFNWFEDNGQRIRLQNASGILIRQIEGFSTEIKWNPSSKFESIFRIASYQNEFKNGSIPFAKNDLRNGYLVTDFMSPEINFNDYVQTNVYGQAIASNSTDYVVLKLIGKDNPYGVGDIPSRVFPDFNNTLTTSDFQFTEAYTEINHTKESDPIVAKNDWEWKISSAIKIQFGLKYRYKIGLRSLSKHDWFQDFSSGNSAPILLSQFSTTPFSSGKPFLFAETGNTYSSFNYSFLTKNETQQFIQNNDPLLREVFMNPLNFEYNQWVGSNYQYKEHQSSGYIMATYAQKKWAILGGVRLENTFLIESSDTLSNELGLDTASNTYYNIPKTIQIFKQYLGVLPSLNANYYIDSNSTLKIAFSRTMHRPNFEETKPGQAVIRYNELEYTFGNPNLKPAFSTNFDCTYEHYFGNTGILTVGAYFKSIQNHIYTVSAINTDPISGVTIRKYGNAPHAWVGGIELMYNRKLTFLKKNWKYLGVRSNITLSMSRMAIAGRPKSQVMTKQTPILASFQVYYEKDRMELNVAFSYTGKYVSDLNLTYINGVLLHKDSDFDTYNFQYYNLELAASYRITKRWQIQFTATNLLNFPEKRFLGQSWRSSYSEYYGIHAEIGLNWAF